MNNILLTGFMGTGKSSVGRALADALGLDFVDTDELIIERHGSIEAIFHTLGEQAFRSMERTIAVELSDRRNVVVSTGGRFMLDDHNIDLLVSEYDVIALVADATTIAKRVLADGVAMRPLLADAADPVARIDELLAERRHGYERFTAVDTVGRSIAEIVADLATRYVR
ncbi:MAG: shikimate kinase [Actinobacteria bacterium]|nr:shikimate kinase [Actinomycetota bacterium]